MEEPSGVPEAWREREGRELFSSDAVNSITEKDVTTTEQSSDCVPYRASLSGLSLNCVMCK